MGTEQQFQNYSTVVCWILKKPLDLHHAPENNNLGSSTGYDKYA